jgi:hypothetical protein
MLLGALTNDQLVFVKSEKKQDAQSMYIFLIKIFVLSNDELVSCIKTVVIT